MPWPAALAARVGDPAPDSELHILDAETREPRTSQWFRDGDPPPAALPARCLAAADLDRDGRIDRFIGCGSDDPFETHADIVLLQTAPNRFETRILVAGEAEDRVTRRVLRDDSGWILDRGSAFPGIRSPPALRFAS